MSQAPQPNVTPVAERPSNGISTSGDPLGRLHKMSTTAGVTNLDYVAVNQTAIAALSLGLLSLLSFFGYLLLVIPVVAVVFAILALRQIGASNGTQTGRGLAWIGLVMAVAFGGMAVGKEVLAAARVRGDEAGIARTISEMGELVRQGKYKEAYALNDPEFQRRVPFSLFESRWSQVMGAELGKLEIFEWNNVTPVFQSAEGQKVAGTKVRTKFEKGIEDRLDVVLREADGRWLILQLKGFFPESAPDSGQSGGSGAPGGGGQNDVFNF